MTTKVKMIAQNPLIIRCHRVMEAFAKSDDEREFYLDRVEGFLVYIDLDKSEEELEALEAELKDNADRYVPIPKLTFYEVKKIMEGFVNEKVYDIDTKEKLIDIIQSKEARENFLEFIYDHHSELEKWQQYYQERFRVRIIEWLRNNRFDFVFEEDLELTKSMVEKLKINTFTPRVGKDVAAARKTLALKAKTYYSSEALNPRPKRGRPPKQVVKVETEPQFSQDIYVAVPKQVKPFLFTPEYHGTSSIFTFSGKFASEEDLLAHRRNQVQSAAALEAQDLNQKLQALRAISAHWLNKEAGAPSIPNGTPNKPASSLSVPIMAEELEKPLHAVVSRKSKPLQITKKESSKPVKKAPKKEAAKKPETKTPEKEVKKSSVVKATASQKKTVPAKKQVLRSISKKAVPVKKTTGVQPKKSAKPVVKAPKKAVEKKAPMRLLRRKK